jgi:hypothetical protein
LRHFAGDLEKEAALGGSDGKCRSIGSGGQQELDPLIESGAEIVFMWKHPWQHEH